MPLRLLALDFDGVLVDSAVEVLAVARATFREVEREAAARLDALSASELERGFRQLIPLGNRAEDFGTTLELIANGLSGADQAGFDRCHQARGKARHRVFHDAFYVHRRALVESDRGAWLAAHSIYPGIAATLRRCIEGGLEPAIATAKDRDSVLALLAHFGLLALFEDSRIIDKSAGRSKRAHLELLLERSGAKASEVLFIDDKVSHLDDVAGLGVSTALAAWGHNGPREHDLAARQGHRVLALEDLAGTLLGA